MSLPKSERNAELVQKRLSDPKKWSWRALGDFYKLHWTSAKQIFLTVTTGKSPKARRREKKLSTRK